MLDSIGAGGPERSDLKLCGSKGDLKPSPGGGFFVLLRYVGALPRMVDHSFFGRKRLTGKHQGPGHHRFISDFLNVFGR